MSGCWVRLTTGLKAEHVNVLVIEVIVGVDECGFAVSELNTAFWLGSQFLDN
jgi:hypothetical protein